MTVFAVQQQTRRNVAPIFYIEASDMGNAAIAANALFVKPDGEILMRDELTKDRESELDMLCGSRFLFVVLKNGSVEGRYFVQESDELPEVVFSE